MLWIVTKYLTTAAIVVLISEVAKRSDKLGALVAALPTVTILALVWMYIEGQGTEKLSNHAFYTFWFVVPTLPMFLLFPYLLTKYSFLADAINQLRSIGSLFCFDKLSSKAIRNQFAVTRFSGSQPDIPAFTLIDSLSAVVKRETNATLTDNNTSASHFNHRLQQ